MNKYYKIILSLRDSYSFLAGIIVSGFVVEISLNTDNNEFYKLTIYIGLIIGVFCYIMIKICKNYNDNLIALNDEGKAWISINKDYSTNKIFKLLPKIWVPILPPLILILFFCGSYILNRGNQHNLILEEQAKKIEKKELLQSLDSLYKNQNHFYIQENVMLQDSINKEKEINTNLKRVIDSLDNQLNMSKRKKKNDQTKKNHFK